MKRIILTTVIAAMCAVTAMAQSGLKIATLLGGNLGKQAGYTEIVVTGSKAAQVGLDVYHSLATTVAANVPAMERAVTSDGSKAVSKEVEYRGGHLYYGYYVLPRKNGTGRFIFFLNQSLAHSNPQQNATLIYMEGNVSSAQIKRLIKK